MFIEKTCGGCGASTQFDSGSVDSEALLEYVQLEASRFNDAHIVCGYMTEVNKDKVEILKRYTVEHKLKEKDE